MVRALAIEAAHARRIHEARYALIAGTARAMSAQHTCQLVDAASLAAPANHLAVHATPDVRSRWGQDASETAAAPTAVLKGWPLVYAFGGEDGGIARSSGPRAGRLRLPAVSAANDLWPRTPLR
jgi:hypothetical protein